LLKIYSHWNSSDAAIAGRGTARAGVCIHTYHSRFIPEGVRVIQWSIRHRSNIQQRPVIGWVTKIYYPEPLRSSESTLICWSRLHLQSLAPTLVSRMIDVRQAAGLKNNCRIKIRLIKITTWWKHVVPTPLSGIRVGNR
jgi:hypothetical protein